MISGLMEFHKIFPPIVFVKKEKTDDSEAEVILAHYMN